MVTSLELMYCYLLQFVASAVDWCDFECGAAKHIRCGYKVLEKNELCHKIDTGMEPWERKGLLDAHNKLREYVASGRGYFENYSLIVFHDQTNLPWKDKSSDMQQITWDYDMETNARIWVSQCSIHAYRPNFCTGTEEIRLVHMNRNDEPKWYVKTEFFFNFTMSLFMRFGAYVKIYADPINITRNYFPGEHNPFYAMIFSKTHKMGCSKAVCHCDQDEYVFGESSSLACIYGPSFDHTVSGFKIYEPGDPCTACPQGTSCKNGSVYPHLCARPDDPTIPVDVPNGNLLVHPMNSKLFIFILCWNLFHL